MAYLIFNNIKREYVSGNDTVHALSGISFEVKQGDFTVILGASGSGKSTLLNLLGGMDYATSGQIFVDAIDITKLTEKQITDYRRTDIGFVFQFYNLIPSLNTFENVDMAERIGKKPLNTKDVLHAVGLESRLKHFPSEMSGGELQRTAIARAIVKNPKLLLCDEPTGALDTLTGIKVLKLLHDMSKHYGKTVVVVTHNSALAHIADKVIHLKDGQILNIEENLNPTPIDKVMW